MLVVLPSTDLNQQPITPKDIGKVLEKWPGCHIFLRPYVPSSFFEEWVNVDRLVHTCASMLAEYSFIPDGQRHLQIMNEPNMPWQGTHNGWEGFGPEPHYQKKFSDWFTYVMPRVKANDPGCLLGSTPLTIGNRDAWFPGDVAGDYYMHGPTGCSRTPSVEDFQQAQEHCICRDVWARADEQLDHAYWHYAPEAYSVLPYGQRHRIKQSWAPNKKNLWIVETGAPNKHFLDQSWFGGTVVEWFKASDNVKGAALWLLGDNPQWGGRMWKHTDQAVEDLAHYQHAEDPGPPPASEPLPMDETATDPTTLAEKCRWWLEEEQRERERGNVARANEIRVSLIGLHYRLENMLKEIDAGWQLAIDPSNWDSRD